MCTKKRVFQLKIGQIRRLCCLVATTGKEVQLRTSEAGASPPSLTWVTDPHPTHRGMPTHMKRRKRIQETMCGCGGALFCFIPPLQSRGQSNTATTHSLKKSRARGSFLNLFFYKKAKHAKGFSFGNLRGGWDPYGFLGHDFSGLIGGGRGGGKGRATYIGRGMEKRRVIRLVCGGADRAVTKEKSMTFVKI